MTAEQRWILAFLKGKDWTSPTEIGREYGRLTGSPYMHSAWASPKCLKMVEAGLLERNNCRNPAPEKRVDAY